LIDQALYFAIGFLAASLAAVVLMPAVSRRAVRLFNARPRAETLAAAAEAAAERDALRARQAVEVVRLERRLQVAQEQSAALRAELGQRAVKLIAVQSEVKETAAVLAEQAAEAERFASDARELEATLSEKQLALSDLAKLRDETVSAERIGAERIAELEAEANRDRAKIAILTARNEHIESRVSDLVRAVARDKEALIQKTAEHNAALATERTKVANLEARLRAETERSEKIAQDIVRAERNAAEHQSKICDLERRLAACQAAQEEALMESARELAARSSQTATLRAAQSRIRELELQLHALEGKGAAPLQRGSKRTAPRVPGEVPVDTKQALPLEPSGNPDMQRQSQELVNEIAAASVSATKEGDDGALRASLQHLGRTIARAYAERQPSASQAPSGEERHSAAPDLADQNARV